MYFYHVRPFRPFLECGISIAFCHFDISILVSLLCTVILAFYQRVFFVLLSPIFAFFARRYFYCFRPFWPFSGDGILLIVGHFGCFRTAVFLVFLAILAFLEEGCFHYCRPFWTLSDSHIFVFFFFFVFMLHLIKCTHSTLQHKCLGRPEAVRRWQGHAPAFVVYSIRPKKSDWAVQRIILFFKQANGSLICRNHKLRSLQDLHPSSNSCMATNDRTDLFLVLLCRDHDFCTMEMQFAR